MKQSFMILVTIDTPSYIPMKDIEKAFRTDPPCNLDISPRELLAGNLTDTDRVKPYFLLDSDQAVKVRKAQVVKPFGMDGGCDSNLLGKLTKEERKLLGLD